MIKPSSMSLKEFIIKKIAINKVSVNIISEKTIEAVIAHQFESVLNATADNNSIEISGFGKFVFNEKRAKIFLEKYFIQKQNLEKELLSDLSPVMRNKRELTLITCLSNIKSLKQKLNETE